MSLYDSARPTADITFRQLMERKYQAACEMLGLLPDPLPAYPNTLAIEVGYLETKCVQRINNRRTPCPVCGAAMKGSVRPVTEPPFIIPRCWNRACESNKGRAEETNHRGYHSDTYGT